MRLREVLLEYSRRRTLATMRDKLLQAARADRMFYETIRDLPEDEQVAKTLDALEAMDPTSNRKYVDWIVREYTRVTRGRDRQQFWIEDAPRVTEALQVFDRNIPRLRQLDRSTDIFRYTFRELERLADELSGRVEQVDPKAIRKPIPDELKDDVDILYAGPDGTLYRVKTWKAARYLGSGTKWCIAASERSGGPEYFHRYVSEGPIYIWVDRKGKWAFVPNAEEFRNARDEMIPTEKLREFRRHPALWRHVFGPYEQSLLQKSKSQSFPILLTVYNYAHDVIGGRWPEAEPVIMRNSEIAYRYAKHVIGGRWPEIEPAIIRDPWLAYKYAHDVIKNRWPEAESVIMRNSEAAHRYAKHVIGGRWREAEPVIMQDPWAAYEYARDVIKNRWPEAEPVIMRDPQATYQYARDVIHGRWPEAEPVIMRDPRTTYQYARDVIRGRWPEAEPVIMRNAEIAYNYARDVLRSPQPEAEATIRRDPRV